MKYLLTFLICLLSFQQLDAQSLSLFDVDATNYPVMKAKFFAFDATGNQQRPNASELTLTENGQSRTITSVSCPPVQSPKALSSVLVMDVSGSMSAGSKSNTNIDLAREAANTWINGLPLGQSETAIVSFDDENYVNKDFTSNKSQLLNSIALLSPQGGTDYNAALINSLSGGLLISENGKFKRIIILLTDGLPNQEPHTDSIINEANRQNCTIYCVTLRMAAPQSLKDIAAGTGGKVFENVTTISEARNVYVQLLKIAQGNSPCELTWTTNGSCETNTMDVQTTWQGNSSGSSYTIPASSTMSLQVSPSYVSFGAKSPGSSTDTTITLTALNADFTISDISSKNDSANFTIVNPTFPLFIAKNTSKNITVRFAPTDSNVKYMSFEISSNLCPAFLSTVGGFKGKNLINPTLKLTKPNAGENFVAGSDTLITWEGVSKSDTVELRYSTDNGASWKLITGSACNMKYIWKSLPKSSSNKCKVKVRQVGTEIYGNPGGIQYTLQGHTDGVLESSWSPDGKKVATCSVDKTAIIWDANTGKKIRTLAGHTTGIFSVAWSPDGLSIATLSYDSTSIIWNVNTGSKRYTLTDSYRTKILRWSPDGTKIATGDGGGGLLVWDGVTGALIKNYGNRQNGNSFDLDWSPDGSKIVGAGNSYAAITDVASGKMLFSFWQGQIILTAKWSPDGSRVAILGSGLAVDTVTIWDANTGIRLYKSAPIMSAGTIRWSPDGTRIAIGGSSSFTIRDANSGVIIHTLPQANVDAFSWSYDGSKLVASGGNKTQIWDAVAGTKVLTLSGAAKISSFERCWHPDELRLIADGHRESSIYASSGDKTAKIWYIGTPSLQEDESDNVFSMVIPQTSASNINMQKCIAGKVKDSMIATFTRNTGTFKCRIDSIYFTGNDSSAFGLVSGIPKYYLSGGTSKATEFRFKPNRVGEHTAIVNIITQSDTLKQTITGLGIAPDISVINNHVDFGQVFVNNSKDTIGAFTIKNIGASPLKITGIRFSAPNDKDFSSLKGGGNFNLAVGEIAQFDLRFSPKSIGRTSGRLLIDYNGVGSPITIQLFGEGIANEGAAPSISSTPNIVFDSVCIGHPKVLQATIKNDGNQSIQLLRAEWESNLGNVFTAALLPQSLPSDSSITININFNPTVAGVISTQVRWIADKDTALSTVSGIGKVCSNIPDTIHTTIAIKDINAKVGEKVNLVLMLQSKSGLQLPGAPTEWMAKIHYNKTILFNEQTNNICTSGNDDSCQIELKGTYNQPNDTLVSIPCIATLGNTNHSSLVIDEFHWTNSNIAIAPPQLQNGAIQIINFNGINEQGGVRLSIPSRYSISLTSLPNPVQNSVQIQYALHEPLRVSLEFLNITGQVVQTIVSNQYQAPGQYTLMNDMSLFGSGVYSLRLTTNKEVLTTRIDVVK